MTLEEDIQKWETEKPRYIELKNHIQNYLENLFYDSGVPVKVETRVKDDCSLIKKINLKQHQKDKDYSYENLTDKCGARIICKFKEDLPEICKIIDDCFEVKRTENKYNELAFYEQGYKGIHKDIVLKKNDSNSKIFEKCRDLPVEIQIRTLCDNVWADIYHDLGYKPENMASEKIKRELHCLGGLLEVADDSFSQINKSIKESTELSPAFALNVLEKPFIQIFRSKYDPTFSTENLNFFINLLDFDSPISFKTTLNEFIEANKQKILQIVKERRGEISNPFITQPEVLIIFYLIETKKALLKDKWPNHFCLNDLEELSTWWGKPIQY